MGVFLELASPASNDTHLTVRLGSLTTKRDALRESIAIGEVQLAQQQALLADFQTRAVGNFGNANIAPNTGVFMQLSAAFPGGMVAAVVVPWLEAWLEQRRAELANTEAQLAALAQSAQAPAE